MKYDFVSLNGLPAVISWLNAHPQWTVISVNNDDGSWWILYSEQTPSKEQGIMKELIQWMQEMQHKFEHVEAKTAFYVISEKATQLLNRDNTEE